MGVPVTGLPLLLLNVIAGFQVYVIALAAVNVAVSCPTHIVELFTATGGKGFTVMVDVAVFVHPLASVPVTV